MTVSHTPNQASMTEFTFKAQKIDQAFFKDLLRKPIKYIAASGAALEEERLWSPFQELPHRIGLHAGYSERTGKIEALAVSTNNICIVVYPFSSLVKANLVHLEALLLRSPGLIIAFDMYTLSMSLYRDVGLRIVDGVDIYKAFPEADRHPLSAIKAAIDNDLKLFEENIKSTFESDVYEERRQSDLVKKAWVAQFLATMIGKEVRFVDAPKINTQDMSLQHLGHLSKLAGDALRMDLMKPTVQTHEITTMQDHIGTALRSTRFQNRIRRTEEHQHVEFQVTAANSAVGLSYYGHTTSASGQVARVAPDSGTIQGKQFLRATTFGKDSATAAEKRQQAIVAQAIQDPTSLLENPWYFNIKGVADASEMKWPDDWKSRTSSPSSSRRLSQPNPNPTDHLSSLNPSQLTAIQHMMSTSSDDHICLVHGPPGTGKTSVIARYVMTVVSSEPQRPGIWLVAQSNVAVKNIAEKLCSVGFTPWRLLVSKDYHFDWHEHQYNIPQDYIIRSDDFKTATKTLFRTQPKVLLCTLSMLCSPQIYKFTQVVPLKRLVVDEASQIKIGDYLPVFTGFSSTLRKICFIGDHKQLAPFGQEQIEDLQSIFEVDHLQAGSLLLDTQYRMPPQIGQFISDAVYDGRLLSNPKHPIPDNKLACQFITVEGVERTGEDGKSFKNLKEVDTVLLLAKHLQDQKLSYRIITGYDAQRTAIEATMQNTEGLDWNDKCFNVDSFQGNEDDYIIISVVRTNKLGFLSNKRRTNVMLSRCKKGMFIIGSRRFIKGRGAESLVGLLAEYMEGRVGEKAWAKASILEKESFEVGQMVKL